MSWRKRLYFHVHCRCAVCWILRSAPMGMTFSKLRTRSRSFLQNYLYLGGGGGGESGIVLIWVWSFDSNLPVRPGYTWRFRIMQVFNVVPQWSRLLQHINKEVRPPVKSLDTPSHLWLPLCTFGVHELLRVVPWDGFPTVLQELPEMLSICWLICL